MDIYESACEHGVSDDDILHAIDFALMAAEQHDGKVLYHGDRNPRHEDAQDVRTAAPQDERYR